MLCNYGVDSIICIVNLKIHTNNIHTIGTPRTIKSRELKSMMIYLYLQLVIYYYLPYLHFILFQKHFAYNNASRRDYKYLIPISYFTQYTDDCYNCYQPKFTISDSGYTFKENLNNGWLILNRNASGTLRN